MEAQPTGNFLYDAVLPKVALMSWLVLGSGLLIRCFLLKPGGNALLLTGLEGLAVVYFLRAFEPSKTAISTDYAIGTVTSISSASNGLISVLSRQAVAFGSAIIFLGIAFKLQFWEGAAIMLPVGIGTLLLAIAWQSSVGILTRQTVLVIGLGLLAWAIHSDALARQLFRDDPFLVEKLLFQQQHPHNKAAAKEARQLVEFWNKRKH